MKTRYYLGLDIGSSSVKLALIDQNARLLHSACALHRGDARAALGRLLAAAVEKFPGVRVESCLASGTGHTFLAAEFGIGPAGEIAALVEGQRLLCPQAAAIIEIGGQSAKYVTGLQGEAGDWQFSFNNQCAAGTGSFFEDQMSRLGLRIEDYSRLVEQAETIPRIAGRCSVFAKTDIIHRQQEGVPKADILLGLTYALVRNYRSTIVKNLPVRTPVLLAGGAGANSGVQRAVRDIFRLSAAELLRPEHVNCIQAAGAAVIALDHRHPLDLEELLEGLRFPPESSPPETASLPKLVGPAEFASAGFGAMPVLPGIAPGNSAISGSPDIPDMPGTPGIPFIPGTSGNPESTVSLDRPLPETSECFLGIDAGSTSTNLVLIDQRGAIIDRQYLWTLGDPQKAVKDGLASIRQRFGGIAVKGVGTTGSGRYLVGKMVGAEVIKDEITAQAKAAVFIDPEIDTVFEIGGQDSKFIRLTGGAVSDFQMNKICAAGTGSFLEEQAARFGLPLEDFGACALAASRPVDLGERCTVFMETNIAAYLSRGVARENIMAGLCYAIVRNYLHKVVGHKPVGRRISLQGGVAANPGIVAAFRYFFGERLVVLPCSMVSGAYGAALLAREAAAEAKPRPLPMDDTLYRRTEQLFLKHYTGKINPGQETVGVPRALVMHKLFPLVNTFFQELGYNVLLSDPTSENTIRLSQEYAREETCYPVKLDLGHMAELAARKVDYIFMPSIYTMKHEMPKLRRNYGCVYMQTAPRFAARTIGLEEKGIRLLNPVFSLDFGKKFMAKAMIGVGAELGKSRARSAAAMLKGAMALRQFTRESELLGAGIIDRLAPDEKVFVMITRNYGLTDPVLSMGIADLLMNLGHKVITLSHLPAHHIDLSSEYPNLYWPFGQHILAGAELVRAHPNLYAIYLTNHGCGPDTMLSHLFREQMAGKPYLAIEVDEHASAVGVRTRLEAFIHSLEGEKRAGRPPEPLAAYPDKIEHPPVNIETGLAALSRSKEIILPYLFPYAELLCAGLRQQGYRARVVPATTSESIAKGQGLTLSKEYLSYTALLGDMLLEAEKGGSKQLLIPQTEGSEADGQYSRLIRAELDEAGRRDIDLLSPWLEKLPQEEGVERFWLTMLAGDIVLAAGRERRPELLNSALKLMAAGGLNPQSVDSLAEEAGQPAQNEPGVRLLLTGEPYVLFNGRLNNGVLAGLEAEGYGLCYSPLSEYLCFLWQEEEGARRYAKQLAFSIDLMGRMARRLGPASGFSPSFKGLVEIADRHLKPFAGGNGRYRYAKAVQGLPGAAGIISLASTYENTATVLSLLASSTAAPLLELAFAGNPNNHEALKLSSFLHHLSRKQKKPRDVSFASREGLIQYN